MYLLQVCFYIFHTHKSIKTNSLKSSILQLNCKKIQYCQADPNQPKSQILFHKNGSPRGLFIMTLVLTFSFKRKIFSFFGFYLKTIFSDVRSKTIQILLYIGKCFVSILINRCFLFSIYDTAARSLFHFEIAPRPLLKPRQTFYFLLVLIKRDKTLHFQPIWVATDQSFDLN